jgi:Zn-dependent M16 (insulinase) family peptidase
VGLRAQLRDQNGKPLRDKYAVLVYCELLNRYLQSEIRGKGNAYGADATYHSTSGQIILKSYRDPEIAKTVAAFLKSAETEITDKYVSEDLLARAKVAAIQSYSKPQTPQDYGQEGLYYYLNGRPSNFLSMVRGEIIDTTSQDIYQIAQQFKHAIDRQEYALRVYGSQDSLERAIENGISLSIEE